MKRDAVLAALQKIVGPRHALTDPALIAGALVEPRGLYHGAALALVRPGASWRRVDGLSTHAFAAAHGAIDCRYIAC
jgi:hypothetical protein